MLIIEELQVNGSGGPVRTLSLAFKLKWAASASIVAVIEGTLSCGDKFVVAPYQLPDFPHFFKKEGSIRSTVILPLTDAAINFIEGQRSSGDVVLDAEIKVRYRDVDLAEPPNFSAYLDIFASGGYESVKFRKVIPHSEWVKALNRLGWSETELFEINLKAFQEDPHLAEALEELRDAEVLFKEGEYDKTLSACANALAALDAVQITGTQAPGVDAIMSRCFRDELKREHVKTLIEATRQLCQLGAKETYPPHPFSRTETEYCLSTTLAVFSLLGHRLAEGTGLRVG